MTQRAEIASGSHTFRLPNNTFVSFSVVVTATETRFTMLRFRRVPFLNTPRVRVVQRRLGRQKHTHSHGQRDAHLKGKTRKQEGV